MSATKAGKPEMGQKARGLVTAMRQCLSPGLLLVEARGQKVTLSPEAAAILGRPGISECRVDDLPPPLVAFARNLSLPGTAWKNRDLQLNLPGRGYVDVRVNAAASDGGAGATLVLTDLSAAMHCEQHLERIERLANLGTLTASTAHEIRNALVAGKTFMDLLLEQNPKAELSEVVRRELNRIEAIVSRLLKFAGPDPAAIGPVRLHEVLDYSLRLLQPQLEARSIAVERDFRAACDLLSGNESSLQQAFINLLLNSAEAMERDGKVSVETQELDGPSVGGVESARQARLQVVIQDNGEGITAENMPHLFEPFFTTKPQGTGLGLAITQRIIQEHRATIRAESKPGSGTRFILTFPSLGPVLVSEREVRVGDEF